MLLKNSLSRCTERSLEPMQIGGRNVGTYLCIQTQTSCIHTALEPHFEKRFVKRPNSKLIERTQRKWKAFIRWLKAEGCDRLCNWGFWTPLKWVAFEGKNSSLHAMRAPETVPECNYSRDTATNHSPTPRKLRYPSLQSMISKSVELSEQWNFPSCSLKKLAALYCFAHRSQSEQLTKEYILRGSRL